MQVPSVRQYVCGQSIDMVQPMLGSLAHTVKALHMFGVHCRSLTQSRSSRVQRSAATSQVLVGQSALSTQSGRAPPGPMAQRKTCSVQKSKGQSRSRTHGSPTTGLQLNPRSPRQSLSPSQVVPMQKPTTSSQAW
jgi:hypothetical protein